MPRQPAKVLYFIPGNNPSQEDFDAAEKIGRGVVFRNANRIVPGAPLENADAVAGPAVPPDYAAVYPGKAPDDGVNPNILLRPNSARTASSGGPDDNRPGTVDDGLAHESGTGSSFAGNPYEERARELQQGPSQRQGRAVWEKGPQQAVEEAQRGVNVQAGQATPGAWPTRGAPGQANPQADVDTSKAAENANKQFSEAAKANEERREQEQRQQQQTGGDGEAKKEADQKGGKSKQ